MLQLFALTTGIYSKILRSLYHCLFAPRIYIVALHAHPVRGKSHNQRNANGEVATTSPPFDNEPHRSHVLFWKASHSTTPHPGHSTILLRSEKPERHVRKAFALRHQATIEIARRDQTPRTLVITFNRSHVSIGRASTSRLLYYYLFAPHVCIAVLRAHPVRGESHNQRNANGEVATTHYDDAMTGLDEI